MNSELLIFCIELRWKKLLKDNIWHNQATASRAYSRDTFTSLFDLADQILLVAISTHIMPAVLNAHPHVHILRFIFFTTRIAHSWTGPCPFLYI